MPIVFFCRICSQKIEAPDEMAGAEAPCPACGATLAIPLLKAEKPPTTTPPSHPLSPSTPPPLPPVAGEPSPPLGGESRSGRSNRSEAGESPDKKNSQRTIDQVLNALSRAVSFRKLGFFLMGAFLSVLVLGLLFIAAVGAMRKLSLLAGALLLAVAVIVGFGLCGVIAGGVAWMTWAEVEGHEPDIRETFRFCMRKFASLFGAAWLAILIPLLGIVILHGFIGALNLNETFGSLLASLLFLPQVALTSLGSLALATGVLIPCGVAVENCGAIRSTARFFSFLVRLPCSLFVHLGITLFLEAVVLVPLILLLGPSFISTCESNGPVVGVVAKVRSMVPKIESFSSSLPFGGTRSRNSPWPSFGGTSSGPWNVSGSGKERTPDLETPRKPWGDLFRWFGITICLAVPGSLFFVYWVDSFTCHYEWMLLQLYPERQPKLVGERTRKMHID
ncbi:MAG: hypothetical protein GXP31_05155 [Kiritimatiellaeota bacterium]|nr:hypothetical protein [Kiritimatiellota bacterium]